MKKRLAEIRAKLSRPCRPFAYSDATCLSDELRREDVSYLLGEIASLRSLCKDAADYLDPADQPCPRDTSDEAMALLMRLVMAAES